MAGKRKKSGNSKAEDRPFGRLAPLLQEAGVELPRKVDPIPPPAKAAQPQKGPPPEEVVDDGREFDRAMEDVVKPNWRRDSVPAPLPTPLAPDDSEREDMRLMKQAASGEMTLPIPEHPEYIEGWVGVAGRRFLPNLRSGVYSIQGALDLHGLSLDEAREAVEEFIANMSRGRSCCVKIIHGRGINSPSGTAILKEHLQRWLATRRMSRHVVAYASAPFTDGGVGAVYVLLRPR